MWSRQPARAAGWQIALGRQRAQRRRQLAAAERAAGYGADERGTEQRDPLGLVARGQGLQIGHDKTSSAAEEFGDCAVPSWHVVRNPDRTQLGGSYSSTGQNLVAIVQISAAPPA